MSRAYLLRPFVAFLFALTLVGASFGTPSGAGRDARNWAFEEAKAVPAASEHVPRLADAPRDGPRDGCLTVDDAEPPVFLASAAWSTQFAGPEGAGRTLLKEARAPPRKPE